MADTATATEHAPLAPAAAPLTADALLADRQKFWGWFTGTITRAVIALAILLVLLWFFLVR